MPAKVLILLVSLSKSFTHHIRLYVVVLNRMAHFRFQQTDRPNTPHAKHSDGKDASTPSSSAKQKTNLAKKTGNAQKKIRHR